MAEDSLLKFIFPKSDPKGIQRGLNFVFPRANFNFAGEDTEENNQEIIDDNETIKINPPIPGKSLISDEIQKQLNFIKDKKRYIITETIMAFLSSLVWVAPINIPSSW